MLLVSATTRSGMMSLIQNAITTKPEARYPAASQSLMAILDVHDCLPF